MPLPRRDPKGKTKAQLRDRQRTHPFIQRHGQERIVATAGADDSSHESSAEQELPVVSGTELGSSPDLSSPDKGEADPAATPNNALMSTPLDNALWDSALETAQSSGPATQITTKFWFHPVTTIAAGASTATRRLFGGRTSPTENSASRLETSEDIDSQELYPETGIRVEHGHGEENDEHYEDEGESSGSRIEDGHEDEDEGRDEDEEGGFDGGDDELVHEGDTNQTEPSEYSFGPERARPTVGGLHVAPRRSERIRAKRQDNSGSIVETEVDNDRGVKRKRQDEVCGQSKRRSARLAKPLDVFHKFEDLPTEIQWMIWEAAMEPRLVYICNRLSSLPHASTFGVQNKTPSWFMTCRFTSFIASRHYFNFFGPNLMWLNHLDASKPSCCGQSVNPETDIVIYEPCHKMCRGRYCSQQYRQEDRAKVRKLAVQIDSPSFSPKSEPGWVTILHAWPNVETLFMMKEAVKGLDTKDKAMIRIKEGEGETAMRKRFEAWKKCEGEDQPLITLEFVRVIEAEPATKDIKDRYQAIEDRKTGLTEDVIMG